LPGQRGLLQALLHYPTVPTEVWGLPIVQAVIAFKVRKRKGKGGFDDRTHGGFLVSFLKTNTKSYYVMCLVFAI
jgi:hypothetical protein